MAEANQASPPRVVKHKRGNPLNSGKKTVILNVFNTFCGAAQTNLTCYQCVKYKNEECGIEDLKPCPPSKDRCVTHIAKDDQNGFTLKRECGLGPCGFEDASVKRGLGMDGCDRSKDEYFCVSCCTESGCNKDGAGIIWPSNRLLTAMIVLTGVCAKVLHSLIH